MHSKGKQLSPGPTQCKRTLGSAQGVAGSVPSHAMLCAAVSAGHAPSRLEITPLPHLTGSRKRKET